MRISPFPTARAMLRVFAKALILLIALDLVLLVTGVDPSLAITRVNLWSIAGKAGIPRLIAPSVYVRGQLPLDGQLAAHTIAYMPKAADEFRVIILGDSAQWGYGLNPEDTLTEQLNAHGLHMNSGKRIVVFNLGLPNFSVVRDTVILDGVTRYQPDLVLWFVTAASLMDVHSDPNSVNSDLRTFFHLNAARLDSLLTRFHQEWFAEASRYYGVVQPLPFWYAVSAVREQDALPVWFDALLLPFTDHTHYDPYPVAQRMVRKLIPATAELYDGAPDANILPNDSWAFLTIGQTLSESAGARLLLINEPMFVGSGVHSDVNYNASVARTVYDRYRQALAQFAQAHAIAYLDLWDAIPPDHFTDTAFHADREGWALIADRLGTLLENGLVPF